jgi:aldehyde dehydrogenase (NAD+)
MENNQFPKLEYDSISSVQEKIAILRKGEKSRKMLDPEFRKTQLKKLRAALIKYEKEIHQSNLVDLGQSEFSSFYGCYSITKRDVDECIEHIDEWVKPRSMDTPAALAPCNSYVIPEPFGVCLILSAWNTQYQTLFMPMAQALAAGNLILAKPSEMAEASAIVSQKILSELDEDVVQVCQGGAEVCIELLKNKFDFIVFTGSPQKGVLVAKAAAEYLTPCILELGGQNPVIVDKSADLENAAYNLVYGRFLIAGQVCIAPEYVFVEEENFEKLVTLLKNTVDKFYTKDPKSSDDYFRIINDFHSERISKLLQNHGGKVITGGDFDLKKRYIAPTIVTYNSIQELGKSSLASSEIFGPILYLAPYKKLDDCIDYINSKEKPLTLYYFGSNSQNKEKIIKYTSSGAVVTNDTIIHFINSQLPFGGVGGSGYSAYHGKWGFDNLSHLKPVMDKKQVLLKLRYPPFTGSKKKVMTWLVNNATFTQSKLVKMISFIVLLFSIYYMRNYFVDFVKGGIAGVRGHK